MTYLRENSHDAIRIMEKPKMDKKRKFLWVISRQLNPIRRQRQELLVRTLISWTLPIRYMSARSAALPFFSSTWSSLRPMAASSTPGDPLLSIDMLAILGNNLDGSELSEETKEKKMTRGVYSCNRLCGGNSCKKGGSHGSHPWPDSHNGRNCEGQVGDRNHGIFSRTCT